MRSPALAIAWEFRQRHRWGADRARPSTRSSCVAVQLLILGPGAAPQRWIPRMAFAVAVIVPLSAAFMYFLAVFSFGLAGDLAARQSLYPARMFTLPVTTARARGLADALRHRGHGEPVAGHGALRRAVAVGDSTLPLIWPALLRRGVPRLDAGADVDAVRPARAAHDRHRPVAGDDRRRRPPGRPARGPRAPDGRHPGAAASPRVSRRPLRRGASASWRRARLAGSVRSRLGRIARRPVAAARTAFLRPPARRRGSSGGSTGRSLPALVGILLPFELGLLCTSPATSRPSSSVLTLLGVLLTPPFMAGFMAVTVGRSSPDGSDPSGVTPSRRRGR